MKIERDLLAYETPQVEMITVEVEKGFAASPDDGNTENPTTGTPGEW